MATTGVTLASGQRVKHSKVREAAFGVTPTSPAFQNLRVTGSTLQPNIDTVESQELRTDRQIPDQTTTAVRASGDLNVELSFNALDDIIEEVMQSAWGAKPNIANTGAGTPISGLSTTTATVASGGAAFLAGMIVQTSGFALAANNKTAVVASSSGTTVVFPSSTFTADASPQAGATLRAVGFQGGSGDITATATGLGSTTLDFTTLGLAAGDWIKIGGTAAGTKFATAANNDFVRLTGVAAHALTCDNLPASWATDSGSGKTISVFFGEALANSTVLWTSTIERVFSDQATPTYEYFTGSVTNALSLNFSAGQIITGAASFVCKSASYNTSRASGATDLAPPAYSVLNATSHFGRIGLSGAAVTGPNYISSASLSINNNVQPAMAVGSLGAVGMSNGDFNATGTLNAYFGDTTLLANLLNNSAVSLNFRVTNNNGAKETYLIDLPTVKLTSGAVNDVAKNRPVMQAIGFRAVRDATLGYTSKVTRFWYTE